jgi:hypothetical protein
MKNKLGILVLTLIVLFLSGCESDNYVITEYSLNGNDIYTYDSGQEICAAWYSMGVDVGEGKVFNIINACPISTVILVDGEYMNILTYIKENEVEISEIENLDFGFITIDDSLSIVLDIDLDEYELTSIIVKELDNEIMTPPQWDTSEEIDLDLSDISEDLLRILSEPLGSKSVCEDGMCRLLYAQGPINIELVKGERTILIELYEQRLNIKTYINGEFESVLYDITDPWGNVSSLYSIIYNRYIEIND